MAAPVNTVLDDFNRADGAPGGNWLTAIENYALPNIVSNALDWPQFPSGVWATQFGADQEAFCKLGDPTSGVSLLLRFADLNTDTESGYIVTVHPSGTGAELWKMTSGVASLTSLGWENDIFTSADVYLWAEVIDDSIKVYGSSDGVTYTLRKTWTDTTFDRSGYIGLFHSNNSVPTTVDDFGGGVISSVTLDTCLPDADITTTGWSTAPLFSKINDASDATVITATAS